MGPARDDFSTAKDWTIYDDSVEILTFAVDGLVTSSDESALQEEGVWSCKWFQQ